MPNGRILVLAVMALAIVPKAWAQEVPAIGHLPFGSLDSVEVHAIDSAENHVPTMQVDSIAARAKRAAKDQVPVVQLPGSPASKGHFKTNGQMELGGIHGPLPYSAEGTSLWNAYAKGEVGAELFGIPVKVLLDLGTDLPVRGQRNSVRFAFDAPRLMDKDKWGQAKALHSLQTRLDSLEGLRSLQYRKVKGAENQLAAYRLPEVKTPGSPTPSVDLQGIATPANPLDTLAETPPPLPSIPAPTAGPAKLDSLGEVASRAKQRLDQLDELVTEQRMRVQRLTATMNAAKAEPGIIGKFVQGIKHLEIGSCSPSSSEFLINGINFQGVSFEYEQKDIYLAFDRGRSFDDTWMDADPLRGKLRLLQQSLFFADAKDLNPRKLTAIKIGVGKPDATHLHVGYLTGSREDVPLGLTVPAGPGLTLRNQVVEVDLGYAVKKNHVLRITMARSVTGPVGGAETGTSSGKVGNLFELNGDHDQAIKLGWSSTIERTGTRAEAEVRSISPYFQSFGMGFIRNGSRAVEARLDQRLGKTLRLRGRYALEERGIVGTGPQRFMHIQRTQAMVMYRPTRSLTLRAGAMPVQVRTELAEGGQLASANRMYTVGGDFRRRWKKTVALLSADLGIYEWSTNLGAANTVENHSISLSILQGERWTAQATWAAMGGGADSTMGWSGNVSLQFRYQARKGTVVDAGAQIPRGGQAGWMAELRQPVCKQVTIGLRGESFSRSDLFFPEKVWMNQKNSYNWTFLTRISW